MAIDICILAFMVNPCLISTLIKHSKRRAKLAGAAFLKAERNKAWHVISHADNRVVTRADRGGVCFAGWAFRLCRPLARSLVRRVQMAFHARVFSWVPILPKGPLEYPDA